MITGPHEDIIIHTGLAQDLGDHGVVAEGVHIIANLGGGSELFGKIPLGIKTVADKALTAGVVAIRLDEPTAGQDYRHYTDIMQFLRSLNREGITIIMITHDMHLMLEYTPHAIVLAGGHKIGDDSAVNILTNPDMAEQANLKLTSLYELAQKAELPDPQGFVQQFIDFEESHREIKTV